MQVAVIGAGVSGIFSIKSCLEEGLEPICFEKSDRIGGLWVYRDEYKPGDPAGVYQGLQLNTSVYTHEASDFPSHVTDIIPSKEAHLEYIEKYAEHFGLHGYIQFRCEVTSVVPECDFWKVTWKNEGGEEKSQIFSAVLVCSGRFRKPIVPEIVGREQFTGAILTANQFKHNKQKEVMNKRVLIVGNSSTAADISALVSGTAKKVYLSIGNGCTLIGVCFCDLPSDTMMVTRAAATVFDDFDKNVLQMIKFNVLANFPEQDDYGISTYGADLLARPFLITSNDLPSCIRAGKVEVKQLLTLLTTRRAFFYNGDGAEIDTIIMATGYDISFPFLSKDIVAETVSKLELYKLMWPLTTKKPNLAIIGCTKLLGGSTTFLELQTRWAVRVIQDKCCLPSRKVMLQEIRQRRRTLVNKFGKFSAKPDTSVLDYQDFMAREIGALPTWWHHLFSDLRLALILRQGPAFSCTYRLQGPHKCPGAAKRIKELYYSWRRLMPEVQLLPSPAPPLYKRWWFLGTVTVVVLSALYVWNSSKTVKPYPCDVLE